MLKDKNSAHQEFKDMYFDYKVTQDETLATEKEIEDEIEFYEDPANYERGYEGRLSPLVKE